MTMSDTSSDIPDIPTGTPETGIDPEHGDHGYKLKDFDEAMHEAPDGEHDDCGGEDEMDLPQDPTADEDEDEEDEENKQAGDA